jgi:AcrR family transcriptional regulator
MSRPRGRPARDDSLSKDDILSAALVLLDEGGGSGLTMRALAASLGITPMGLYHHVRDHAALLRALADKVYGEVCAERTCDADPAGAIRQLLLRYYGVVTQHPQLTLAIFSEPQAFAGVNQEITDQLTSWLAMLNADAVLWRDILIDHAHGSGLARVAVAAEPAQAALLQARYLQALDCLLAQIESGSSR